MSSSSSSSSSPASLASLPADLHQGILESVPDMASMFSAMAASSAINRSFRPYEQSIATKVLKKQLPWYVWEHAVVCQKLADGTIDTSRLQFGKFDPMAIRTCIKAIRRVRDAASTTLVSARDGLAMSRLHDKVLILADNFFRDCAMTRTQCFGHLHDSLRRRGPSEHERIRVEQAIYLFQMVASLCKNLAIERGSGDRYMSQCTTRIGYMQLCITSDLMSPWEFYQVMGIQGYFRRAIHGLDCSKLFSERVMPYMLAGGINCMHDAIHTFGPPHKTDFLHDLEALALERPQNAFGLIVSRGHHRTWTRGKTEPFEYHEPFALRNDWLGFATWIRMENRQAELYDNGADLHPLMYHTIHVLEGRLDLWSAALWDVRRWREIEETIDTPYVSEEDAKVHWCSMKTGLDVLLLSESEMEDLRQHNGHSSVRP
ncbi:hypothetical protein XA68_13562 [Ophiocordyceps unilateralis]|uniref:Uncharacterized protein n=1 Tax=Ophiocordyceps unilateralis TaxID=268505 RepID=A0A2A9PAV4_OPHUN|nr:hypothetical protein XA68_13562 [Ophiocordyceps unilateralis]